MALLPLRRSSAIDAPGRPAESFVNKLVNSPIFETLQIADFRWIWIGSFASFMAMNMQMITRGWLILRLENDSPFALALAMLSFAAPMTFMSLVGGALADRFPKKYLVFLSQIGSAIMTFTLATMVGSNYIWFGAVMVIGVLNGSLMAINMPSRQAIISEVVPDGKLMNAVALNNSAMNLTRILGPALAGFLIVYIDTAGVFYITSIIYLLSAVSMLLIKDSAKAADDRPKRSILGDIGEGMVYAKSDPRLLGLIIMAFIPSIFGFVLFALFPAWAREALNVRSTDLGILMMVMGIGALIGTLGLASLRKFNRRGMLLLVSSVIWGLALVAMAQSISQVMAMPFLLLIGFLSAIYMSLNMTLTQIFSVPEMRGRMMSIVMMTFGLMPIGALGFGYMAEYIGTPLALTFSGIALAVVTVLFGIFYAPFRRIE